MHADPGNQGGPAAPRRWSGRTRRIFTTAAASTVLLGAGAGIGVALTGGASASTAQTSPSTAPSASPGATSGSGSGGAAASRCAKLVQQLVAGDHTRLASRLHALCTTPLLRLALVGGEHGTVTFNTKNGPTTALFERGTVESDSGSVITVKAADNTTWSWDITSSTVVRQGGSKVSASDITGDQVFVAGTVVNGANDARLIRVRSGGGSNNNNNNGGGSSSSSSSSSSAS
jgi:hypothetical protein